MSDKALDKIQALLNLAEHEGTSEEEAQAFREKAEALMTKYAIEEHMLVQKDTRSTTKPVVEKFDFCEQENDLLNQYYWLLNSIANHNRCRVYGTWKGEATIVGYESDVWITKLMYTSVRMHMMGKTSPHADPSRSYDENVYNLHEAGLNWERICKEMNSKVDETGDGWPWTPWPDGGRLIRAARRQAKREGVEYVAKANPKVWRRSFADGYYTEISYRLRMLRKTREEESGESGALVLVDRSKRVDEAFYEMFPGMRPRQTSGKVRARKYREQARDASAEAAGRAAGATADLSGGANRLQNNKGAIGG